MFTPLKRLDGTQHGFSRPGWSSKCWDPRNLNGPRRTASNVRNQGSFGKRYVSGLSPFRSIAPPIVAPIRTAGRKTAATAMALGGVNPH